MQLLVFDALGRRCACMAGDWAGNPCPDGGNWHTWRQHLNAGFHARLATCFVGTDHGNQPGILKVRFADAATVAIAVQSAQQAGFEAAVERANRVGIITNPDGLHAGPRSVLIDLIQSGLGAFALM